MCAPRGRRTTRTRTHGGGLRSALRPEHGPRPLLGSRRGAASRRVSKTPRSRRTLSADPAALSRGGRTGTCRCTAREPVTVCRHNLGGRPAPLSAGRAANLAPPGRARARADRRRRRRRRPPGCGGVGRRRDGSSRARAPACRRRIGLAEYPVYDPQTGVARDPRVTEAAMCVRLVDVRITCGLHDDAQIAAVFIDPRAK